MEQLSTDLPLIRVVFPGGNVLAVVDGLQLTLGPMQYLLAGGNPNTL